MEWLEIKVEARGQVEELAAFLASLDITELVIEDGNELSELLSEGERYWDAPADELKEALGRSLISFYLPDDMAGLARYRELEHALSSGGWEVTCAHVRDSDWENSWKRYYRPIPVGQELLILPDWLDMPEDAAGRVPLRLDPGLIFGTGSHPTTRMCLEALEPLAKTAGSVLDLGCGSGILSIAALLLGAGRSHGLDIDPLAPRVAMKNAALNGITDDRFTAQCGDVSDFTGGSFDLILANIIADVILTLIPAVPSLLAPGGRFICSGIIAGREAEIEAAASANGLTICAHHEASDWHCYVMSTNLEVNI